MNAAVMQAQRPHLATALKIATWIDRARIPTQHGCTWLTCPHSPDPHPRPFFAWSLHYGAMGVVLFWVELYCATNEDAYLHYALDGADHLRAVLPLDNCEDTSLGMYFGLSGAIYVFEVLYQVAGREQDHHTAAKCMAELRRHAQVAKANNLTWSRGHDIGGGRAGAALIVLWWRRVTGDELALDLAVQAGHAVIRRARPHPNGGVYWPGVPKAELVGFTHYCSGAAYFLATLYEHTKERAFLDTAVEALYRLQRIAIEQPNGGCLIPSIQIEGNERVPICQIQWCNGAVGILRPFAQLGRITGERQWTDWVHKIALGVMKSGIPEHREYLMPRSAILCCGDGGVSETFLDLSRVYKQGEYFSFSRRMYASALSQATVDHTGMCWYEGKSESEPQGRALIGLMSGAAGLGMLALRFDAREQNREPCVKLPDSPFWGFEQPVGV